MVSVVLVASYAGVSPATVPRALAGRAAVATATRARTFGYRNEVARSLRVGCGRSVALAIVAIEQGSYASLAKHVRGELGAQAKAEALAKDLRFGAVVAASHELALGYSYIAGDMTVVRRGDVAGMGFSYSGMSTVVRGAGARFRHRRFLQGPRRRRPARQASGDSCQPRLRQSAERGTPC
jgi:DNA-binding LacI/PurR family transcriptional regulator